MFIEILVREHQFVEVGDLVELTDEKVEEIVESVQGARLGNKTRLIRRLKTERLEKKKRFQDERTKRRKHKRKERLEDGLMDQQIAGASTDPRDLPRSVIHVIFITFAFSIVV